MASEPRRPLPKPPATKRERCPFNLCACAEGDVVWAAERPGQTRPDPSQPTTPRGPLVASNVVDAWCAHVKAQGVARVLCLLSETELGFYSDPLLERYARHFGGAERVTHCPPGAPLDALLGALRAAQAAREPVVVHCSTGQGRAAAVCALWLHHAHALDVPQACQRVSEFAAARGATRKPTVEAVLQLALGGANAPAARAMPTMLGAGATPGAPLATPRARDSLHVTFVQTGGTIDKDYPRSQGGWAFEISEPAAPRVLAHVPCGFTHDVVTVCRKDSQEIEPADRQSLLDVIRGVKHGSHFVVTHGTDTLVETARFLAQAPGGLGARVVVVTGAMKPERFVDSDAAFNIGAAVGALNVLGAGVFVCMNGRIFDAMRAGRDGRTGKFISAMA